MTSVSLSYFEGHACSLSVAQPNSGPSFPLIVRVGYAHTFLETQPITGLSFHSWLVGQACSLLVAQPIYDLSFALLVCGMRV